MSQIICIEDSLNLLHRYRKDPDNSSILNKGLDRQISTYSDLIDKHYKERPIRFKYNKMLKDMERVDISSYRPVLFTYDPYNRRFFDQKNLEFYSQFPISLDKGEKLDETQRYIQHNLRSSQLHNHNQQLTITKEALHHIPLYAPPTELDDKPIVSRKIKLNVPTHIRKIYQRWFALHKKMYNASIAEMDIDIGMKKNGKRILISKLELRTKMLKKFRGEMEEINFSNISAQYSVFEAHKNYLLADKTKNATCSEKTKTLKSVIEIDPVTKGIIYKTKVAHELQKVIVGVGKTEKECKLNQKSKIKHILNKSKIKLYLDEKENNPEKYKTRTIPNNRQHKLEFDRQSGHYYLIVCQDQESPVEKPTRIDTIVAVDPGVTPFVNFYSTKVHGSIGGTTIKYDVKDEQKRSDNLLSCAAYIPEGLNSRQRFFRRSKLLKRAATRRTRAHNIVKDLHNKSANFLAKNFDYIFLPEMRTRDMVSNGNMCPSVNRAIMISSQYQFRQKVIRKCKQFRSTVIFCEEYFTTQTCSRCGSLSQLGGKKVYDCSNCGLVIGRDYNSARNIMMKNITLGESLPTLG